MAMHDKILYEVTTTGSLSEFPMRVIVTGTKSKILDIARFATPYKLLVLAVRTFLYEQHHTPVTFRIYQTYLKTEVPRRAR